jgi:hypothetical protein
MWASCVVGADQAAHTGCEHALQGGRHGRVQFSLAPGGCDDPVRAMSELAGSRIVVVDTRRARGRPTQPAPCGPRAGARRDSDSRKRSHYLLTS